LISLQICSSFSSSPLQIHFPLQIGLLCVSSSPLLQVADSKEEEMVGGDYGVRL
jgi:hypothetical protein